MGVGNTTGWINRNWLTVRLERGEFWWLSHETLLILSAVAAFLAMVGFSLFLFRLALRLLVANPFQVGAGRFFVENNRGAGTGFSAIGIGFSRGYGNIILTQFLKDLWIFLWSLLFLIPGIVRAYAYFAVPYILAENPEIDHERALQLSRAMTMGWKSDIFCTHLSFIGWAILSGLTCGILGIFWVDPWFNAVNAEMYAALRENALDKGIALPGELPDVGGPEPPVFPGTVL